MAGITRTTNDRAFSSQNFKNLAIAKECPGGLLVLARLEVLGKMLGRCWEGAGEGAGKGAGKVLWKMLGKVLWMGKVLRKMR
jgi:hypothetical protein